MKDFSAVLSIYKEGFCYICSRRRQWANETRSGIVAKRGKDYPRTNFWLSQQYRKIFLSEIRPPKMQRFGLKALILENVKARAKL